MADDASGKPGSGVTAVTRDDGGTEATTSAAHDAHAKALTARAEREAAEKAAFLAADTDAEFIAEMADRAKAKAGGKRSKAQVEPESEQDKGDDDSDDAELEAKGGKDKDEDEPAVDDDDELELDDLEDDEVKLDADEDDVDREAAKKDPDLAKRLAKLQKREARMREQATERERAMVAKHDAFVAEWTPRVEKALTLEKKFDSMKGSRDLLGILKMLDFPEDMYEEASQELWGLSKTGRADPKYRDAAARLQEKRSLRSQADEANARVKALEDRINEKDAKAEAEAKGQAYMGRVHKAIGDDSPLVKKRLELKPESTQRALAKIALALMEKTGTDQVDPKRVVRTYEKNLRSARELAKQLADDNAAGGEAADKKPGDKKSAIKVVDKTKTGKSEPIVETKKPTNGAIHFKSRREMLDDLTKIERGELDPNAD